MVALTANACSSIILPSVSGVMATGALSGAIAGLIPAACAAVLTNISLEKAVAAGTCVGASTGMISGTIAAVKTGLVGSSALMTGAKGSLAGCLSGACTSIMICNIANSFESASPTGSFGRVILGCSSETPSSSYTFDCWKPILHDDSVEPSNGRLLRDVVVDKRIKQATVQCDNDGNFSQFTLENIWDERFEIEFFCLMPEKQLVAHARKI